MCPFIHPLLFNAYRLCSLGSCTTDSSQVLKGCHRHPREVGGIEGFDWLSAIIILNTDWLLEALVNVRFWANPMECMALE